MYETQCMKRRCFEPNCSSLTLQQPPSLFLCHLTCSHSLLFALLTPLWTDDCTVSIKLENTFVNSYTQHTQKKDLIVLVCLRLSKFLLHCVFKI